MSSGWAAVHRGNMDSHRSVLNGAGGAGGKPVLPPILVLAWQRYLDELEANPLRCKAVTAAVIAGLSDLIAQRLTSSRRSRINWRRTLCIMLWGLCYTGPANHMWQQTLERIFPNRADPFRSAKKVALDQLSFGPLSNMLMISFFALVVEGRPWGQARRQVAHAFPAAQRNAWRLWPAAQFINQQFVPLDLRVLFNNTVSLVWTVLLIMRAKGTASTKTPPRIPVFRKSIFKLHAHRQ